MKWKCKIFGHEMEYVDMRDMWIISTCSKCGYTVKEKAPNPYVEPRLRNWKPTKTEVLTNMIRKSERERCVKELIKHANNLRISYEWGERVKLGEALEEAIDVIKELK